MTATSFTAGGPVHLTRFIGRRQELASLSRLFPTTRLLTLTGAGGSGKTRLAAEVVASATGEDMEVAWVDLAPLNDAALLPHQIVAALGAREQAGSDPLAVLWDHLNDRRLLLVLDNCEHLVDACANLAQAMLLRADTLQILATSREALGIGGEIAWLVPPMSLPNGTDTTTAGTIAESESVQLFVERAQAVLPSFELTDANAGAVAQICRRLDGIPLAIELAAARARALSPSQIAHRLHDAFRVLAAGGRSSLARHRTLRETIDWSYRLLTDREQRLLARLSVFAGGFSLEAAEQVAPDDRFPSADVLDTLCALVDKSLVTMYTTAAEARYSLLETVSQYAANKLAEQDDGVKVRLRHAEYYVAMAETAAPRIVGGASDSSWLARLGEENDNLRRAMEWCAEDAERTDMALRLTYALHWFWFARGQLPEGRQRLEQALGNRSHASPIPRGRALVALNQVTFWQGHHPNPRIGNEAVALIRPEGDAESLAYALCAVSVAHYMNNDAVAAGPPIEEAWICLSVRAPTVLAAIILYWRSRCAQAAGNLELARASAEGALAVGRQLGSQPAIAHPLTVLGSIATAQGQYEEGISCLTEALEIHAANEDRWGAIQALHRLCEIAAHRNPHTAARLLGITAAARVAIGAIPSKTEESDIEEIRAAIRKSIGEEPMAHEIRQGQEAPFAEGMRYAVAHVPSLAKAPLPQVTGEFPLPIVELHDQDTWGLLVAALGGLQITRGFERLEGDVWGSAKARELLLFLLCHRDGCTKEQVALAFWPDGSTSQVRNNFHVTLHRLRKALGGAEWIELTGDRYALGPAVRLEFDARVFEDTMHGALAATKRQTPDAVDRLAVASSLYHGDLLAHENVGDWCEPFRSRLHRLYCDGTNKLADLLVARQRHEDAAEVLEALIARNPLHEESYRRLIACYSGLGRSVEALRLYQRLADLLRIEFGAAPSRETTELIERLRTPAA